MSILGDIQKLDPGSIVELFELDMTVLGGSILRFHSGVNLVNGDVIWQGNTYTRYPVEAEGFEFSGRGQLPRPTLRVANVNQTLTPYIAVYSDLVGAKLTRKRTFVKYLDPANFTDAHFLLSGAAGSYVWTPDAAANDVLGDIELEAYILPNSWTPGTAGIIIGKRVDPSNRCYWLKLQTSGALRMETSVDGSATSLADSTVSLAGLSTGRLWVKGAKDVNNGASGNTTVFSYSPDRVTWTQLGAPVVNAGVTSIFNSSSAKLEVGSWGSGGSEVFAGKIFYAGVRSGLAGAIVAEADPYKWRTGTTFVSNTGEVWTFGGTAKVNTDSATPDPTAYFSDDVYYIDRKARENKNFISFELASVLDLAGVMLPRRQIVQNVCPFKYRGSECSYAGGAVAKADDTPTAILGEDACGKRLASCKLRFGANAELPYGGYPAAGLVRV